MKDKLDARGNFPPGAFGHPRPQMEREWVCLNGLWEFSCDPQAKLGKPSQVKWEQSIVVPFAPETPASGVGDNSMFKACWYRRQIARPSLKRGERMILHFGAVDYQATVWVNDQLVGTHEGGYTPFSVDITDSLRRRGLQTIVVRAVDDPLDMEKPRGKQDWRPAAHGIWYPRTSGIWQTVWYEVVPAAYIRSLRWSSNTERWAVGIEAEVDGAGENLLLSVQLVMDGRTLAHDSYLLTGGRLARSIALPDPGIDDERNRYQWRPGHPVLFDAIVELRDQRGQLIDRVTSYAAMRSAWVHDGRFMLNNEVCFLRMALDQGYWADTGLTAPDDAALKRDVELAKAMGLNAVRKHQKLEDPRYLYWADKLGLMVWQEMPSPYAFSPLAAQRLMREWQEALVRDASHPCVVARVPFNESWGLPDLPRSAPQREFVRAVCSMTKAFDPGFIVISNSGWEGICGDAITIHDYDSNPESFQRRYAPSEESLAYLLESLRPGGKVLLLDGMSAAGKAIFVDEMGGVRYEPDAQPGESWGYSDAPTPEALLTAYERLVTPLRLNKRISGFCWTQFTNTYQEANGLLFMDRTPKVDLSKLAVINGR